MVAANMQGAPRRRHGVALSPPTGTGSFRAMSEAAIRALVASNPGQATVDEYLLVYRVLAERAPCRMLVFGVGRDTPLWLDVNAGGTTVFLEDVPRWATFARQASPGSTVYDVDYGVTRRFMWPLLRRMDPSRLMMRDLPPQVTDTPWDLILVDAPRGTNWKAPGRMKSVYTASVLAAKSGADVFVHDCHRRVERETAEQYLRPERFVAQAGSMRHYRFR